MERIFSGNAIPILYSFISQIYDTPIGKEKRKRLMNLDFISDYEGLSLDEDLEVDRNMIEELDGKNVLRKLKKGDEKALFAMAYYMELLGNANYVFSSAFLPLKGTIITGALIQNLFTILDQIKSKQLLLDILFNSIFLDTHLKP